MKHAHARGSITYKVRMSATPVTNLGRRDLRGTEGALEHRKNHRDLHETGHEQQTNGSRESAAITTSSTSGREARPASLATAVPSSIAFTASTSGKRDSTSTNRGPVGPVAPHQSHSSRLRHRSQPATTWDRLLLQRESNDPPLQEINGAPRSSGSEPGCAPDLRLRPAPRRENQRRPRRQQQTKARDTSDNAKELPSPGKSVADAPMASCYPPPALRCQPRS